MSEIRAIGKEPDEAAFYSVEAEQQVIGALFNDNTRLSQIRDFLTPDHFFDPVHSRIYAHALDRATAGNVFGPATARAAMGDDPGLAELGGQVYLARLSGAAVASAFVKDYADLIVELWNRRALRQAAQDALQALSGGADSRKVLSGLQGASGALSGGGKPSSVSMLAAATEAVERMNAAYQGTANLLKTGIGALDDLIGGIDTADLVLIGGTTSMGKTATAIEIARNIAGRGQFVPFVSREMTEVQLASRMIATESHVAYSAMRQAETMSEADFRKVVAGAMKVGDLPIRIVSGNAKHIRDVESAVMRACDEAKAKPAALVVDYAQLLTADGRSETERMVGVADWLKDFAKRVCPVIALVQVDRTIDERHDKRPQASDIRGSAQFENNADTIIMCHREEYWLQKFGPTPDKAGKVSDEARADHEIAKARCKNQIELIVRKQRSGETGIALVGCHVPTNRFWRLGGDVPL